ncbi:unnamed protein product, partial [Cylicostephanus goldi]
MIYQFRSSDKYVIFSLNVANNMLHHRSSLPPEVIALLSGLSQIKLDGNPLMVKFSTPKVLQEFPPSLFLLSTDNFRLIRQLFQTTTSLPLWTEEPCTPYYWAMHLRNRGRKIAPNIYSNLLP